MSQAVPVGDSRRKGGSTRFKSKEITLFLHPPNWGVKPWALSIQPKSNGTVHFGSVRPEYLGSPLKVVHFVGFYQSGRNAPLHLTKLLSLVPLFCFLVKYKTETRSGVKRSIEHVEFPKF